MNDRTRPMPLLAGLAAARANLLPGILIQATMLALVGAYYLLPSTRHALDLMAVAKARYGFGFTFVVIGFTAGILPEILRIAVFQLGRPARENFRDMAFGFPFWGTLGCVIDVFYLAQAHWFGTDINVATLTKKVLVDMLIFTPLWGTPSVVISHEWKRLGFPRDVRRFFTLEFYRTAVFPVLIANWGVWTPAVCIIYSLPLLLQIPLFALTNCFWSLLVTYMARNKPLPIGPP